MYKQTVKERQESNGEDLKTVEPGTPCKKAILNTNLEKLMLYINSCEKKAFGKLYGPLHNEIIIRDKQLIHSTYALHISI